MNECLNSLMLLGPAICFSSYCCAGEDILEKVPDLRKTAQGTNAENPSCGIGTVTLITSQGEVNAVCTSDSANVFGREIKISDILALLQARIESSRTGTGPMSGEVKELCRSCLSILLLASDPRSMPVIKSLLDDHDETIRELATIALLSIAGKDRKLREQIRQVSFSNATAETG